MSEAVQVQKKQKVAVVVYKRERWKIEQCELRLTAGQVGEALLQLANTHLRFHSRQPSYATFMELIRLAQVRVRQMGIRKD